MSENLSQNNMENTLGSAASGAADLLKSVQQTGKERYDAAKSKLREHWSVAKEDMGVFKQKAMDYSQNACKVTNAYAHDHPWRTAGAAIGVGALLGWLISRR